MTTIKRRGLTYLVVFSCVYIFLFSSFFNTSKSFAAGAARGTVIVIPVILMTYILLTIYYTRKNTGDWAAVRINLHKNLLGLLSFKIF